MINHSRLSCFPRRRHPRKGFSLIEVLAATAILVTLLTGLVQLFIYCAVLANLTREITWATIEASDKMEEIRRHTYSAIATDYAAGGTPGNIFNLTKVNGVGRITVDSSNANLLLVEIAVSWRAPNGRVMGEDTNLNGSLEGSEDANGNGHLDSPVLLVSYIAQR